MQSDSSAAQASGGRGLTDILTVIQNGVTAANGMTQDIKLIFPSSS